MGSAPPTTSLPKQDGFSASDPQAIDWLADAEITVSYAVLDYANDARGGRIKPQRLSENLDPSLALPNPSEVIESIAIRSDPAAYLRSFQPDQPQFEALRQKLIALRGGKAEPVAVEKPANFIPDGPVLKLGVVDPQVALVRKRLDVAANPAPTRTPTTWAWRSPCSVSSRRTAPMATARSAPARAAC